MGRCIAFCLENVEGKEHVCVSTSLQAEHTKHHVKLADALTKGVKMIN